MYLVPLVVFLVTGFILLTGRRLGLPDKWSDRILDFLDNTRRRLGEFYARFTGRPRNNAGGRL